MMTSPSQTPPLFFFEICDVTGTIHKCHILDRIHSTHEGHEKCLQHFSRKA